jgi:uncharacterized protein YegL
MNEIVLPVEPMETAETAEERWPCVLLLDTSASMRGKPIEALNEGLRIFRDELLKDAELSRKIELAVVTFDSDVELVRDFTAPEQFDPPVLAAQGLTRMGAAIEQTIELLHHKREAYANGRVPFRQPVVFLVTDGEPQMELDEDVARAVQRLRVEESRERATFFGIGMLGADLGRLREILVRKPHRLRGLELPELFRWMAACLRALAQPPAEDEPFVLPPGPWSPAL